jgi:hypothetical protein
MVNSMNQPPPPDAPWRYQIKVEGHLNPTWSAWFEELTLTHDPDGSTLLSGVVIDQAALHGVLVKIRDLGLTLIAVQRSGNGI